VTGLTVRDKLRPIDQTSSKFYLIGTNVGTVHQVL